MLLLTARMTFLGHPRAIQTGLHMTRWEGWTGPDRQRRGGGSGGRGGHGGDDHEEEFEDLGGVESSACGEGKGGKGTKCQTMAVAPTSGRRSLRLW